MVKKKRNDTTKENSYPKTKQKENTIYKLEGKTSKHAHTKTK